MKILKLHVEIWTSPPPKDWELPLPATFVIAQDRRVALAYVDVDYRRRLAPEDIVATLRRLAESTDGRALTSMRQPLPRSPS